MKVTRPILVTLPDHGVVFAQSTHAPNFRMKEREEAFHKLVYVLAGELSLKEGGHPEQKGILPGTMLVIPRGVRHEIVDHKQSTLLLLCLDEPYFATDPDLAALWGVIAGVKGRGIALPRPGRLQIEALWQRAMLEISHPRLGHWTAVKAIASQILVFLARLPAKRGPDSAIARVTSVVREIDETFFDDWSLDRAAIRAGLSRRRFSALFRDCTQKSFGDYLTDRRLTHAAGLLRLQEQSILGVMFSCGLKDLSNFYRLFRAKFGVPPRKWANVAHRVRDGVKADTK